MTGTAYTWTLTPDPHNAPHGIMAEGRRSDGAYIARYYPDRWTAERALRDDAERERREQEMRTYDRHRSVVSGNPA
jgi:hypothetical protein